MATRNFVHFFICLRGYRIFNVLLEHNIGVEFNCLEGKKYNKFSKILIVVHIKLITVLLKKFGLNIIFIWFFASLSYASNDPISHKNEVHQLISFNFFHGKSKLDIKNIGQYEMSICKKYFSKKITDGRLTFLEIINVFRKFGSK